MTRRGAMSAETRRRLREIPGFKDLPDATIARIDASSTELTIEKGHYLTKQGAPGREAFVIVAGTAAFSRDGQPPMFLPPGALVGELALLDGQPRVGSVVAVTPLTVLVLSPAEFGALCDDLGFTDWMQVQVDGHKPK